MIAITGHLMQVYESVDHYREEASIPPNNRQDDTSLLDHRTCKEADTPEAWSLRILRVARIADASDTNMS
jgi:hypothetical protein